MNDHKDNMPLCIEPHGIYTKTTDELLKIVNLVPSPWIQVNWELVAKIMEPVDREIFLSVECGKIDEVERSISYPNKALAKWLA